jgi:hypothetical protein
VCECAGAVPKQDTFTHVVDSGKWGSAHKGSSNMISAMIKYGTDKKRFASFTDDDLRFAGIKAHGSRAASMLSINEVPDVPNKSIWIFNIRSYRQSVVTKDKFR